MKKAVAIMNSTVAALVLLALVSTNAMGADQEMDRPKLAVMPLVSAGNGPCDGLGTAIQNLLENTVAVHPGLEEFWFLWTAQALFSDADRYLDYVRGRADQVDFLKAGETTGVRYWIYGTYEVRDEKIVGTLHLTDARERKQFDSPELVLDPSENLTQFREKFLRWLHLHAPAMPEVQKSKALWPEHATMEGLSALGIAYEKHCLHSLLDINENADLAPFVVAVETAPKSYMAANLLGWAHYTRGDYDSARQSFERAINWNPHGLDALDGLAWCAFRSGNGWEAMAWLERKVRAKGEEPGKSIAAEACKFGDFASRESDHENAIFWYGRAAECNGQELLYFGKLAGAFGRLDEFEQGIGVLEAASEAFESDEQRKRILVWKADIQSAFGEHLKKDGKLEPALLQFGKALATYRVHAPENVAWNLSRVAEIYKDARLFSHALDACFEALEFAERYEGMVNVDSAIVLGGLASVYEELFDYPKARTYYERALAIFLHLFGPDHPNLATPLDNLARVCASQGDYFKAKLLYERALEINKETFGLEHPAIISGLKKLADVHSALGDQSAAEILYDAARSIENGNDETKTLPSGVVRA